MFCSQCGLSLTGSAAKYCSNCGRPTGARPTAPIFDIANHSEDSPVAHLSAAGFYQDPFDAASLRYWSGATWSEKSLDVGSVRKLVADGTTPPPTTAIVPILPTDPAKPGFYTDVADPPRRRHWTGDLWGEAETSTAESRGVATASMSLSPANGNLRFGEPPSATTLTMDPRAVGIWPAWMYALVLVPSVLLMLVAAATASSSSELSATLSTIDDLLNIPMFLFILLFGIWDSKRVCRATGTRGWLTALAVLVAVVYVFVRQSKARQTQLPAFTFLGMGLAYGAFVFAAMASSFGGASGHVTCTDLVSESIRISEEIYKGSETPLLVGVRDVTLILDNQGNAIPPRSGEADALVCRGTGTFSDSSVSNVSMTYSVDSGGNGFISYQPE